MLDLGSERLKQCSNVRCTLRYPQSCRMILLLKKRVIKVRLLFEKISLKISTPASPRQAYSSSQAGRRSLSFFFDSMIPLAGLRRRTSDHVSKSEGSTKPKCLMMN